MTRAARRVRAGGAIALVCVIATTGGSCRIRHRTDPVRVSNPALGRMSIAVAPALNVSGSSDFDVDRFADLMAAELSYAEGITVIPVSRVLGVLATQGKSGVESASHALELARLLGANGILVFAVTAYDPYDPPTIGISAQLYGTRPGPGGESLDPVALSRMPTLASSGGSTSQRRLLAQTQRVFDGSHSSVASDIKRFAELRRGDPSPWGWRKYMVSQQHYIRYCCHATVKALLSDRLEVMPAP